MPSTYEHKALIEQLRKLSADKSASENPSEASLSTTHPSGDSSIDDDGTAPATTGARASENEAAIAEGHPAGTESSVENSGNASQDQHAPGTGENDVPTVLADDPQDPPTSHPAGGKESSVEALLKEANEIGSAIRDLIKASEDGDYAEEAADEAEEAADEAADEADDEDDSGEKAAKVAAEDLTKVSAEIREIEQTLKEAANRDADAFTSVMFSILKKSMPLEAALAGEEEEAPEEEAEEALAQMAMTDAAPAEEEAPEEEVSEEAAPEEAIAPEELMAEAAPMMAEEAAPAEEEALSPEEQMMLMQLLSAEGMGGEDVAAYGKMSAMIESGDITVNAMSKAQQNYFNGCSQSAKSAQAKFDNWKASSVLANELNGIYNRGAK